MAVSPPQPTGGAPHLVPLVLGTASYVAAIAALEGSGLPTEDLSEATVQLYALVRDGRAVAFCGLEGEGADRLLRSVVAPPDVRGRGYGAAIVHELLALSANAGVQRVWLLTTDASAFFDTFGFGVVSRDAAPPSIRAAQQFESLCPESAALMSLSLLASAPRMTGAPRKTTDDAKAKAGAARSCLS